MSNVSLYEETAGGGESIHDRVLQHTHLVKRIAHHLVSRLPSSVQLEDLIQAGMVGLIEASQRFDSSQNVSFETYASSRIRGSMLDDLRKSSWMPRSVHSNMRRIAEAIRNIEFRTAQPATAKEIAAELGISLEEYYEMSSDACANNLFSIDEIDENHLGTTDADEGVENEVQRHELKTYLSKIIRELPQREQLVLAFYYTEKLRFKEIGDVLEIGEARVCQLHTQAVARLKAWVLRDKIE